MKQKKLGGLHGTEVANYLLTQLPQALFLAVPRIVSEIYWQHCLEQ